MFCTNCGKELVDGARFCVSCGTAVESAEANEHDSEESTKFDGFDVYVDEVAAAERAQAPAAVDDQLNVAPTVRIDPVVGSGAPGSTATSWAAGAPAAAPAAGHPAGYAQQPQPASQGASAQRFPVGLVVLALALAIAAAFASYFIFTNVVSPGSKDQPAATEQAATENAEQDAAQPAAGVDQQEAQTSSSQEGASASSGSTSGSSSTSSTSSTTSSSSTSATTAPASGDYVLADSNSRYYSRGELEAMDNETLYHARNEIYARHGRQFKKADLQSFFGSKSWYSGTVAPESFSDDVLNDFERKNAELMRSIEEERNSPYLK